MRKFILFTLLIFSFNFIFSNGCIENHHDNSFGVISLAPNITEIIYALNQENLLIGRTEVCNYPSACKKVKSVGNPWKPNAELIISLKPELVLASSLTDSSVLATLQKAGIKTVRINKEQTLEGMYYTIEEIGKLLDCTEKSSELKNRIESHIDSIQNITSKVAQTDRKKGIYLMTWNDGPLYAATGNTFIDDILNVAGVDNIARNSSLWTINREMLISNKPDYIFIPYYENNVPDIEQIKKSGIFTQLQSEFILINGDETERQGPRNADVAEYIAKKVYPDLFKETL